jgi:hypothetical protein
MSVAIRPISSLVSSWHLTSPRLFLPFACFLSELWAVTSLEFEGWSQATRRGLHCDNT